MIEEPSATLILCDFANSDRGKWNILGAGWTRCSPTRDVVFSFAMLQVPPEVGTQEMQVEAAIWDADEYGQETAKPAAATSLTGEYEVSEGEREPPVLTLYLPLPIQVKLRPEAAYVVEFKHNGLPLAWAPFFTAAEGEVP